MRVTEQLAADVAAGLRPRPDLVLWPENSSDIDPLRNPDAAAQIDRAARAVGVPIVLGTVLVGEPGPDGTATATNSVLVWEPGVGVVDRTDKRRVQPFGEYLPWRPFFRLLSDYADRAGNFVPGRGRGRGRHAAGVRVGIAICWEIAFDDLVADSVAAGAQVLAVPSNNATFGRSEMTYQQLAMSRVRAVEHDRAVIVVTTSGVSATIAPDGTVTAATSSSPPTCWSAQRRCGPPLRWQIGCGRRPSGCCRRPDWRGRVRPHGTAGRRPDDGAYGRTAQNRDAQERTRMAEGPDGSATAPVLVVIPTYNERDNIEPLLARLHAAVPGADVLVVDDGSPDGTGELADKLAADDPRVRVLHRTAKAGLGAAYLAGFAVALQGEHQVVVEMDADGCHAPEDLPALLAALEGRTAPTWCSARATCPAGRWSTGPPTASGSPGAGTCTRGSRWACRSATSPAGTAPSAARCWRS